MPRFTMGSWYCAWHDKEIFGTVRIIRAWKYLAWQAWPEHNGPRLGSRMSPLIRFAWKGSYTVAERSRKYYLGRGLLSSPVLGWCSTSPLAKSLPPMMQLLAAPAILGSLLPILLAACAFMEISTTGSIGFCTKNTFGVRHLETSRPNDPKRNNRNSRKAANSNRLCYPNIHSQIRKKLRESLFKPKTFWEF